MRVYFISISISANVLCYKYKVYKFVIPLNIYIEGMLAQWYRADIPSIYVTWNFSLDRGTVLKP